MKQPTLKTGKHVTWKKRGKTCNKDRVLDGKHISTRILRFGLPFKRSPFISKIFWSVGPKLSHHLHSDRNFRNFWVNGKQPMQPGPRAGNHKKGSVLIGRKKQVCCDWSMLQALFCTNKELNNPKAKLTQLNNSMSHSNVA